MIRVDSHFIIDLLLFRQFVLGKRQNIRDLSVPIKYTLFTEYLW